MDLKNLSKVISHALRHEPWLYELELDEEGWVCVDLLLSSLRVADPIYAGLTIFDLQTLIESPGKKRHELKENKIRALYGHSTPQKLLRERSIPPAILYHGTAPDFMGDITKQGLLPMQRHYVHLSVDRDTAMQVGLRKTRLPVILVIDARAANEAGVSFYWGSDQVWLADLVPANFISHNQ